MKKLLISLVRFYRRAISPLFPGCCRYIPTCSQYAIEALEKYGAVKGSWLALKRLLRSLDRVLRRGADILHADREADPSPLPAQE